MEPPFPRLSLTYLIKKLSPANSVPEAITLRFNGVVGLRPALFLTVMRIWVFHRLLDSWGGQSTQEIQAAAFSPLVEEAGNQRPRFPRLCFWGEPVAPFEECGAVASTYLSRESAAKGEAEELV